MSERCIGGGETAGAYLFEDSASGEDLKGEGKEVEHEEGADLEAACG